MMTVYHRITTRPNPFSDTITLEITTKEDKSGVVRMINEQGAIIRLFLWTLKKGVNITSITNLNKLTNGIYLLDVMDENAKVLCSTRVIK